MGSSSTRRDLPARKQAASTPSFCHHALRAVPHRLVERGRREVERRQQLALPIGAGLDAVHLRHELQELVSAEMVRREKSLGQIDEGTARLGRARGLTENLDPAPHRRWPQVEQALDAGGLARAIDPGQSEDLSGANLEREIGQHRVAADPLAYALKIRSPSGAAPGESRSLAWCLMHGSRVGPGWDPCRWASPLPRRRATGQRGLNRDKRDCTAARHRRRRTRWCSRRSCTTSSPRSPPSVRTWVVPVKRSAPVRGR